ncbi:MAG TPA: hypothetical protein VK484_04345 [Ferruginibacter sp.]|nr:hypothetical protein [Ferruginibacter sp.]
MKQIILVGFLFLGLNTYSQTQYQSKSGIYSFEMPDSYKKQISAHERNEFVFTNIADTTSLVVNVNIIAQTKENITAFKKATNSQVESIYFKVLKDPKIVKRGDLLTYKDQSIYFHVKTCRFCRIRK